MPSLAPTPLNPFVTGAGSPPIPEAHAWGRRYDGARGPLLDLSQAAPAAAPHPGLLRRLAEGAGSVEATKYGPIGGDAALKTAYAAELRRLYGGRVEPAEVTITAGCNLAFFAAAMLVARQGDCILLPTPWYFNHRMTLDMLGIEARPLPCRPEDHFAPNLADAEARVDERVRALVLVTPNNPTGAVYPPERIAAFAELCRRKQIHLIVDETYRDFLPPGQRRPHDLFARDDWRETVIQLYSFSKSYAIPGHRAGALTASAPLARELAKILDCLQICPPRAVQMALPWSIEALAGWREDNRAEMNRRVAAFRRALAAVPAWQVDSAGAYFAYLRHPRPGRPACDVAEWLAVERGVLCLPGSYFGPGQDGYLRVALANLSTEDMASLSERLQPSSLLYHPCLLRPGRARR
jgi:aspartate/methionine/tyrosine aminotransferase